MQKQNFKTESWLPQFPGFYESIFDIDYSSIESDIKELIEDEKLAELCIEEFHYTEESSRVWENWKKQVVRKFNSAVESILKENGFIEKIVVQNLYSPKEYNFNTDSINVEYEFSEDNVKAIQDYIRENFAAWEKYLLKYKSRDGFISFHDYFADSEEWIIDTDHALSDSHNMGSVLEFILENMDLDDYYLSSWVLENCYADLDIEALQKEVIEKTGYKTGLKKTIADFIDKIKCLKYLALFQSHQIIVSI